MGQKVNPISFRLNINRDWQSKWIASKGDYKKFLLQDIKVRKVATKKLGNNAGVAKIELERTSTQIIVTIHTARPGVIIGRGGAGVEELKKLLEKAAGMLVKINIMEIRKPELEAKLVADNVAVQLEKRIGFRRAMKMAVESSMRAGAKGVKIAAAGRLGGADMSRREVTLQGSIPLHTLRADISFAKSIAWTTFGVIGIKVWIYRGEVEASKEAKVTPMEATK